MLISNRPTRAAQKEEHKSNTVPNQQSDDQKEESKSDPIQDEHDEVHQLPSSYAQINQ